MMWQTQYNPYNQYQIGNSFPNYQNTYQQQPQQNIASGINGRYVDKIPFLFLRFLGQSVCKGEHDVARD